jgi:hypothetical protein
MARPTKTHTPAIAYLRTSSASNVGADKEATSESDLQLKWELHLVTAAHGLYIATHRGVQLGIGVASDTVRHQGGRHG